MYIHQDSEPQTRKGDCYCVEITSQEHDIESQLVRVAGAVARQLRTQAALPEDLGLIPNTQMVYNTTFCNSDLTGFDNLF